VEDVMTADTLSSTFDLPLEVEKNGNRWVARLRQE
jgi:hypothetical protein